jgi:hypothetical protein
MNKLLIGLASLSFCVPCFADVTVIYRKADKVIAGVVHPPHSVQKEIENITRSELGGTQDAYANATVADAVWAQRGDRGISIDDTGQVVFVPDPKIEAKKTSRDAAIRKLKALGLTDEEIDALFEQ